MKRSIRKQRDRQLEEPYRSWIKSEVSLPADVITLSRKIDVRSDAMRLSMVVIVSTTIAFPFLPDLQGPLKSTSFDFSTDGILAFVLIGSVVVFLHVLTIRRLYWSLRARREQRRGKLRQGIIVGPDGILIRLCPNQCFVVPLEKFMRAKTWAGGGDSIEEYICIETKDGDIDFSDRFLAVDADAVNQSVFEARMLKSAVAKKPKIGK